MSDHSLLQIGGNELALFRELNTIERSPYRHEVEIMPLPFSPRKRTPQPFRERLREFWREEDTDGAARVLVPVLLFLSLTTACILC